MYKAEFDRLLQQGVKEKNFILFGESSFFIDRYSEQLANIVDANKLMLYFDEYDFQTAKLNSATKGIIALSMPTMEVITKATTTPLKN